MSMLTLWLAGSIGFILAELVLPGQVAIGLGMGGLVVALGLWLGLIEAWPAAVLVWLAAAAPAVLIMRAVFCRFMPGETVRAVTDEDAPYLGRVVQVVEAIEPGKEGRVAFGDTTWPAISAEGRLEPGMAARLLMRDGLSWVVKPIVDPAPPDPKAPATRQGTP